MQAVSDFQFLPLPLIFSEESFEGGVVIRDPLLFSAVLISLLLLWQTWWYHSAIWHLSYQDRKATVVHNITRSTKSSNTKETASFPGL